MHEGRGGGCGNRTEERVRDALKGKYMTNSNLPVKLNR